MSIDGLQPEHDVRRKPATYERILKNIVGQHVCVHCTITAQMMLSVRVIWKSSLLSGRRNPRQERSGSASSHRKWAPLIRRYLSRVERERVVFELLALRKKYSKLDMQPSVIENFLTPPSSPECASSRRPRRRSQLI